MIRFRRRLPLPALLVATALATAAWCAAPAGADPVVSAFPSPGTLVASPTTQISLRGIAPQAIGTVTVTGSRSGRHAGVLRAHSDGQGASFVPARPFADGERVTVRTGLTIRGAAGGTFTLRIAAPQPLRMPYFGEVATRPGQALAFHTRRDLLPPKLTVVRRTPATAPGYLFYAPKVGPGQDGPAIVDDSGQPVYLKRLPRPIQATDFRVQRYRGQPVLTYWQGPVRRIGIAEGEGEIVDSSYGTIARITGANGYRPDLHEFLLTPRDTAVYTAYRAVAWDLSAVGGPRQGSVLDSVVQEIDIPTGLVLFEWHTLGNVPLTDARNRADVARGVPWDPFHVNSVDADADGNLLISARNTWTVYDVDASGRTAWQLGGSHSSFPVPAAAQFAWQHDARFGADGTITVFDNGAAPPVRPRSRALTLRVDPAAGSVSMVGSPLEHRAPDLLAANQGSFQPLPNGNAMVGWGNRAWLTEFGPDGSIVLDARLPANDQTYRAYRFEWHATPATHPSLVARRSGASTAAWASWNGATEVRAWQLLAGASADALAPLGAPVPRSGFETTIRERGHPRYVAVRALDAAGNVLATSHAKRVAG